MKLLLDIQDDKAPFIVEMLKNFKYVKAKPLTAYKSEILEGLKEGIDEMQQIKQGKLKGVSAKELLNEL
jgi:hypothetical protein